MSLLEALVALVILGVSAAGFLDVFQGGARSLQLADEWERTVAIAESTMESALLGDVAPGRQVPARSGAEHFTRALEVRPWAGELREVVVTVTSPRGASFVLRRLVREQ